MHNHYRIIGAKNLFQRPLFLHILKVLKQLVGMHYFLISCNCICIYEVFFKDTAFTLFISDPCNSLLQHLESRNTLKYIVNYDYFTVFNTLSNIYYFVVPVIF